ncbi:MAG TPA: hypothetical protein VEW28_03870 [Candidatus Kapabacteria bacterium]|nr:hypothetical protein [Candidatus Kapabacteria bacterium]
MMIAAGTQVFVAIVIMFAGAANAQTLHSTPPNQPPTSRSNEPSEMLKTIDDLMHDRLDRERTKYGPALIPEQIRLEANYIRTDAPTSEVVLHEASFNLQSRYMSHSPEGRRLADSMLPPAARTVMYFIGSARTPLALPLVSNLSSVLSGDEASYTVYIGVLPLPRPTSLGKTDSITYYCIIQRAIEDNRTDNKVPFERYSKEFTVKVGEPIRLRMDNTPPDKQAYIVKLDDSRTLNFYEDFARHFNEDILLNGERLNFDLGKATLSPVSSRLSIKYTVAQPSHVMLELLSVVDPAHPLTLIDSVMPAADYLIEHDMKPYSNGTYRYRLVVNELGSGNVLFDQTKDFEKSQPVLVGSGHSIVDNDTLEVGGKHVDMMAEMKRLNSAYEVEKSRTERLNATLAQAKTDNEKLKQIVDANQESAISGLRIRGGLGFGHVSGTNLFVGVESAVPKLSLDISYGLMGANVPYLTYDAPQNFSQYPKSPKSLGLQFGWAPISLFDGAVCPVVKLGYYGIYSATTSTSEGGIHSAAIIAPAFGITTTPGGPKTDVGVDLTVGPAFGLGVNQSAQIDIQARFFVKF